MLFTDNMMMPAKVAHPYAAETMMNYVYEPEVAAKIAAYVNYISPVQGVQARCSRKTDPELANNPLIFPPDDDRREAPALPGAVAGGRARDAGGDGAGDRRLRRDAAPVAPAAPAACSPSCSSAPGLLWLIVFFAIPLRSTSSTSRCMTGDPETGYAFDWAFGDLHRRDLATTTTQFLRSIGYAGVGDGPRPCHRLPAGVLHRLQGGPLAQPHAAADHPAVLHELPAADGRLAADPLRRRLGRRPRCRTSGSLADDGRLLATRTAVIAGITYNFLPFMALPLYVSLEKIDRRLIEAATDLYASRATAFRKVTLPLALPGHLRRLAADVHPGGRRLHQRRAARDAAPVHDRQRHPVEVPDDPGLPDGGGAVVRPDGADPDRDLRLRPRARAPATSPRRRSDEHAPRTALRDVGARRLVGARRCSTCSSRSSSSSCSRSTTTRAASTSPGRASRSTTGRTRSRTRTSRRR